jgi:hypothetical protein
MKFLKNTGKVILRIALILIAVLILFSLGGRLLYWDYFRSVDEEFAIPGLSDGFVPQGFDYVEEQACFLISGYMADHSASRVYVRYADGMVKYVTLRNTDGSDYTEHAGGICHNGNFVYMPGLNGIEVFSLSDILSGTTARMSGMIATEFTVDYCSFYDGQLWTGNFYFPKDYETPAEHHITTPAGDENKALLMVFDADESFAYGIDPQPVCAFSTPKMVQGVCFADNGQIILSTSYAFFSSHLLRYQIDTQRAGKTRLQGEEVPLYYLDSANLVEDRKLPPMSEEPLCVNGKVYILCESASSKYLFGKLIRGDKVFSYQLGN